MMDFSQREAQAMATYNAGLRRIKETPEPKGQKYPRGTRVFIRPLGGDMAHFKHSCWATVEYTYAHAYGGSETGWNARQYSLNIDGHGSSAWYPEEALSLEEVPVAEVK